MTDNRDAELFNMLELQMNALHRATNQLWSEVEGLISTAAEGDDERFTKVYAIRAMEQIAAIREHSEDVATSLGLWSYDHSTSMRKISDSLRQSITKTRGNLGQKFRAEFIADHERNKAEGKYQSDDE